jgi:putative transposase
VKKNSADSLTSVLTDGLGNCPNPRALAQPQKTDNMSYVKTWIHLVFSTKDRTPFLTGTTKTNVIEHIAQNCKEKDIFLQAIGGHNEHIHCLISLGKDQSISKVSQLIKGETSFWINKNRLGKGRFEWQDDYFAVSVSHSQVEAVMEYIKNQEVHHSYKSFAQEVDDFLQKYEFGLAK